MQALKEKTVSARDSVKQSMTQASRWELLGGPNEQTTLYAQKIEELIKYPITLQEEKELKMQLEEVYKEQANKACAEIERLLAMNYTQKARLESMATKDNWARDSLGIVDANIRTLTQSHDQLLLA